MARMGSAAVVSVTGSESESLLVLLLEPVDPVALALLAQVGLVHWVGVLALGALVYPVDATHR